MSKFHLFVMVYSGIMLVLFFTFCLLMTRINPHPQKQEPGNLTRASNDFIYSNEILTNDNVAYGLEKVYDAYDPVDELTNKVNESRKNIPTIYIDKNFKTNDTTKKILITTMSIKHIKALRRSIDKENQQDDIPRSVHLKIKDLDGQPSIEIKVIQDKSKSKQIRKYSSSTNITNNTLKFYIDNDKTKYVYDDISKEIILVIGNNDKLVFDFAKDSINLYNDNTLDSVNDIINTDEHDEDDSKLLNHNNITETNDNIYNHGLHNSSSIETNTSKMIIMNRTESINTNIDKTTESMSKSRTNEVNSMKITLNSLTFVETTEIEIIQNSTKDSHATTKSYVSSDDRQTGGTSPVVSVPVNTLVGLLNPETTATLPFNYHFIN